MRCAACHAELPQSGRFCPECAAPLNPEDAATMTVAPSPSLPTPMSGSFDHGRFLPGSLLVDRYRVINLIGRGGMGEVYRASDLTLNQQVALKFLPHATAGRPDLLERFHGEARIARQVSHPNVCRVYDIGEVEGSAFISMEYVDGEDLASLLRRIGRLPADKAIEIARNVGMAEEFQCELHVFGRDRHAIRPANVRSEVIRRFTVVGGVLPALGEQRLQVPVLVLPGLAWQVQTLDSRHSPSLILLRVNSVSGYARSVTHRIRTGGQYADVGVSARYAPA